jgi:hypothetical protein
VRETAGGEQPGATPPAVWVAAGALVAVLVLCASRYGFHRDELYFVEGGHHPAVGQPDNPMGVPLLARWWSDVVGGRLWAFRILPALASGVTVLVAAWTCRAFGGSRMAQIITAVATASMSIVLGTGHLFSTTTFDLTLTSAAVLLLVWALQEPARLGRWIALGVVVGVAMEVKILPAVLLATCLAGLLVLGPRKPLLKPGPYLAGVIALVLAAPYLVWQAAHDWPMLTVAANIAEGGSVSSASRILVVPLSLVMIGPLLCLVAILGVVTSLRAPERGRWGWIGLGYLCLLVFVVVTGGKPYYLAGYFPALLALGARPLAAWLDGSRRRTYGWWTAVAVFAVPTAVFSLPLAPIGSTAFQVAASVNPDGAETVGWPAYVDTVRQVAAGLDDEQRSRTVIITDNYGEAGALTRARRTNPADAVALPPVFSGHNAFADWGPPPAAADTAILVGDFDPDAVERWLTSCGVVAELSSPPGVDNEEDGAPVRLCSGPTQPWAALWPSMRHLG